MLRKTVYPKVESLLNDIAKKIEKYGITPNQLTLAGLGVNFLTGWIYASGHLVLGGFFVIIAAFGDLLDGPLARVSGKASKFGALLDSTVDRYSDFFIFGGLALYFLRQEETLWFLIVLGIIAGSFATSYVKARAEGLGTTCDVGFFERAERLIVFVFGSWFTGAFPLILLALFFGTNATAIYRLLHVKKNLA